jgi:hypothetical protein
MRCRNPVDFCVQLAGANEYQHDILGRDTQHRFHEIDGTLLGFEFARKQHHLLLAANFQASPPVARLLLQSVRRLREPLDIDRVDAGVQP